MSGHRPVHGLSHEHALDDADCDVSRPLRPSTHPGVGDGPGHGSYPQTAGPMRRASAVVNAAATAACAEGTTEPAACVPTPRTRAGPQPPVAVEPGPGGLCGRYHSTPPPLARYPARRPGNVRATAPALPPRPATTPRRGRLRDAMRPRGGASPGSQRSNRPPSSRFSRSNINPSPPWSKRTAPSPVRLDGKICSAARRLGGLPTPSHDGDQNSQLTP